MKIANLNAEEAALLMAMARPNTPGAIPHGARIRKINSAEDDTHADGATGVVLKSVGPVFLARDVKMYGYFVFWDDADPATAVFIRGDRIEEVSTVQARAARR